MQVSEEETVNKEYMSDKELSVEDFLFKDRSNKKPELEEFNLF